MLEPLALRILPEWLGPALLSATSEMGLRFCVPVEPLLAMLPMPIELTPLPVLRFGRSVLLDPAM
jgi:hypothetical protein